MAVPDQIRAVHLPGGNLYDHMQLDLAESYRRLDGWERPVKPLRRSRVRNLLDLVATSAAIRFNLHDALILNGLKRQWFDEFREYWSQVLGGRPLRMPLDLFMLTHDYRRRQQHTESLEWSDPQQHLANWQHPHELYELLRCTLKLALGPVRGLKLWRLIKPRSRVLEYGCALAPYYNCYRQYFSHLQCQWTLADIPNYPFYYARYRYGTDGVDMVTINAEDFTRPLGDRSGFDAIILTTVLEHVDQPLFLVEYLLDRLNDGGLLVFDYIKSHGTGLDHPNSLRLRRQSLELIIARTEMIHGRLDDLDESVGLCFVRKRTAAKSS